MSYHYSWTSEPNCLTVCLWNLIDTREYIFYLEKHKVWSLKTGLLCLLNVLSLVFLVELVGFCYRGNFRQGWVPNFLDKVFNGKLNGWQRQRKFSINTDWDIKNIFLIVLINLLSFLSFKCGKPVNHILESLYSFF